MFKKSILLAFFFGFFVSFVNAQVDPMNLPKLTQYVSDFSNVIDPSQLTQLQSTGYVYDQQTSNQILAVLIPNRNGRELFDIGMKIFKDNKIGQAGKNNGLLLVISTEEKKIRIVVGYGLESEMPDLLASRIIEEDIRPLVNAGDFAGAVRVFYQRSIDIIAAEKDSSSIVNRLHTNIDFFGIFAFILGIILALLFKLNSKLPKNLFFWIIFLVILGFLLWVSIILIQWFLAGFFFLLLGGGSRGRGGGFSVGFGSGGGGGGFSGGGGSSGGGGAGD